MIFKSAILKTCRLLERKLRLGSDNLRRTTPLHSAFGCHRGTPVDRHYIERFLASQAASIHGDALEMAEDRYISRIGGKHLTSATTFHIEGSGSGRLVGDLTKPESVPENRFDCFVCTQTLNFIFDVQGALRGCHRLLKPGGKLLLTVAGTTQISRYDADRWGDYWRFTEQSLVKMVTAQFGDQTSVSSFGNVLTATAMLHGVVCEELTPEELDVLDPDYPVTICAVAEKIT